MVYFLENNNFQRFQSGSNILRGGGGEGKPIEIVIFYGPPIPLCIRACSAFTCSSDPVIDLHLLFVSELGRMEQSFLLYIQVRGAQWLSGRVLDSRLRGRGFEPHWRHCVESLSKTN